MKKSIIAICAFVISTIQLQAQETTGLYLEAISALKQTPEYKELNIEEITSGSQTVSFTNLAYAFWLDGMDTQFEDKDFNNFYGDLYIPIKIKGFKSTKEKGRSKFQLYVSETENSMFIIELLIFKKKQKAKYPEFYNGRSLAFLFEKRDNGLFLVETLSIQNN